MYTFMYTIMYIRIIYIHITHTEYIIGSADNDLYSILLIHISLGQSRSALMFGFKSLRIFLDIKWNNKGNTEWDAMAHNVYGGCNVDRR